MTFTRLFACAFARSIRLSRSVRSLVLAKTVWGRVGDADAIFGARFHLDPVVRDTALALVSSSVYQRSLEWCPDSRKHAGSVGCSWHYSRISRVCSLKCLACIDVYCLHRFSTKTNICVACKQLRSASADVRTDVHAHNAREHSTDILASVYRRA